MADEPQQAAPNSPPPPKKSLKELTADVSVLVRWAMEMKNGFMPETVRRVEELQAEKTAREIDDGERILYEILKHIKGYTNVLLALGYGGILTIWSNSKDIMLPAAFAGAGAAVILSLLLFIGSEIWQTRILVRTLRGPLATMKEELSKNGKKVDMIGNATFWPIIVLGFGGGFAMFLCYVGNLITTAAKAWG